MVLKSKNSENKLSNKGFTLIELIASLVLAGILAAVAGMGIVQASKAFLFTRATTELGQKNELAMVRMRRSLINLTDLTAATADTITLKRMNSGNEITEQYQLTGTSLNLIVENNGISRVLVDNVQDFSLSYRNTNNDPWTMGDPVADLAHVGVDLTLAGGNGINVQFSDSVVPRNTYIPTESAGSATGSTNGEGNPFCFIKTRVVGGEASSSVMLLREFRDKVLFKVPLGKAFVDGYYKFSPIIGKLIDSHPELGSLFRFVLAPFTGFFFLILHYPFGLLLIAGFSWIVARIVVVSGILSHMGSLPSLRGNRGTILISLIITMVIMALLSVAMVSLFSTSVIGAIPPQISQRAYYIAESGKRYAIKAYIDNEGDDSAFINALRIGTAFPVGTDSFTLNLNSYWYNKVNSGSNFSQVNVSPYGAFPANMITGSHQGYLQIPDVDGIVRFTGTDYDSGSDTLQFSLASSVTVNSSSGGVFPAFMAGSQTFRATELGKDPDSANILVPDNPKNTDAFPEINGVISLTDSSDNSWILVYRKKLPDGSLAGLQYLPGFEHSSSGITLSSDTPVVLGRHAVFSSTGVSGFGAFQSTQTIRVHQPLDAIEIFKKVEGGIDFNDPGDIGKVESKLGDHVIDRGALKVSETSNTYSYTSYDGAPVSQQESLAVVKWDSPDSEFLKKIWDKSNKKLSYDLQAKIKFTEAEDDTDDSPVNHPGCYMPGISFRVLSPKTGSFGQATYYGLSLMRGITGIEEHSQSNGGCGNTTYWYTESDDITDNFFNGHGSTTAAADIGSCPGSTFTASDWTDDPPLDGIPYLVLWQKDVSTDSSGDPVNSGGCGGDDNYSPWEWLSYMPLVEVEPVVVYRYRKSDTSHDYSYYEGWIDNNHCPNHLIYTGEYAAWKLKDRFGVLGTSNITEDGITTPILGSPGPSGIIVRDPSTVHKGDPIGQYPYGIPVKKFKGESAVVGYILDPTSSYATEVRKSVVNYKIYPKPWTTLMVRVFEMEGDLDCNHGTGDSQGLERVNAISAYIASQEQVSGSYGDSKDGIRKAYPRGDVKWPGKGDFFTTVIWKGLDENGAFTEDTGYTSKLVPNPGYSGCGGKGHKIKLVEKGKDNVQDNILTYTATYTTKDYFSESSRNIFSEFGLHSLGISADSNAGTNNRETVYFDDFFWSLWEGGATGMFPGLQEQ
jgi:prepilin-type N-terminal cleavage/methylation domain-containing protein